MHVHRPAACCKSLRVAEAEAPIAVTFLWGCRSDRTCENLAFSAQGLPVPKDPWCLACGWDTGGIQLRLLMEEMKARVSRIRAMRQSLRDSSKETWSHSVPACNPIGSSLFFLSPVSQSSPRGLVLYWSGSSSGSVPLPLVHHPLAPGSPEKLSVPLEKGCPCLRSCLRAHLPLWHRLPSCPRFSLAGSGSSSRAQPGCRLSLEASSAKRHH